MQQPITMDYDLLINVFKWLYDLLINPIMCSIICYTVSSLKELHTDRTDTNHWVS